MIWRDVQAAPVRRHIEAGVRLLQSGQDTAAEQQWREAVRLDPRSAEAWELLGDFYLNARNWRAAREALGHVAELNSGAPEVQARLALCAYQTKDFTAARRYAQDQLKQTPDDIAALQVLAGVEQQTGQPAERLRHLQRLVELQPQSASALGALVDELGTRHEYDKVIPLADRLAQLDPASPSSYSRRGMALFTASPDPQALSRAEADFRKVLELNPHDVEAHRYLGRIYLRRNQPRQAIAQFEAVGRGRPYAAAHWLELSNAYRKAGDADKADALRQRFFALKQENRQIIDVRNRLGQNPGSFDNNLQMALLLLKSVDSTADSYQLYSYRYANQGLEGVEHYLQQALELRPHDPQAQAAVRQLEQTYRRHLEAGRQALARGDSNQAGWHLHHARLLRPHDERTRQALQQLASRGAAARPTAAR